MRHPLILPVWLTFICCVIVGSLAPATSPLMVAVASLHIYDKVQHFGAYLVLAFLPAIGFRDRHRGIVAVISIFALGVLLEAGQHFSAGRTVDAADVVANTAGIGCALVIAFPLRCRKGNPDDL